jgi:hypothetical protein
MTFIAVFLLRRKDISEETGAVVPPLCGNLEFPSRYELDEGS